METASILDKVITAFSPATFIKGIVLGGSRATGVDSEQSDIDIGLYYHQQDLDYDVLNQIAQGLDDENRTDLICREGDWGQWVNFGGWLTIGGKAVDLIFRDIGRVQNIIDQTNGGLISNNYQTGHPHAFQSYMYRGELASSIIIYARDSSFNDFKALASIYPAALQQTVIQYNQFEAEFSFMLARKSLDQNDLYYLNGHVFRMISALNQIIFAKNKAYLLNEKKATLRVKDFQFAPINYKERINEIYRLINQRPEEGLSELAAIQAEVNQLLQIN